jgi:hypothetical protein
LIEDDEECQGFVEVKGLRRAVEVQEREQRYL